MPIHLSPMPTQNARASIVAGVERVKKLMRVYPLAEVAHPPEMNFVNISDKASSALRITPSGMR
jgi:hypothetical protein